jgi:RHS repeat-associated protein
VLQAGPVGNQTVFAHDTNNRLETATLGANTTYFSFDTTKGWRLSQGATSDENDPRIRYTYTGTGRLASYLDETRSPSVSASYDYDGQGQRLSSSVTIGEQTTSTSYVYDGLTLLRLHAEQSGGTSPSSWQITYLCDELGRPYAGVYREPATSTIPVVFGIVTTDRGDVVELVDAAGSPFSAYRYDAWGNPQGTGNVSTGVWSQSTSIIDSTLAAAIATHQPLRYAGYCYDSESGLYYLSARHYDSGTDQFLTKDPATADGQASAYQYCGNSPVEQVDPSGAYSYGKTFVYSYSWKGNYFSTSVYIRVSWTFNGSYITGVTWGYNPPVVSSRTPNCYHGNRSGIQMPGPVYVAGVEEYWSMWRDQTTVISPPGTGPRYQGWTGKLKYLWGQSYLAPSTTTGNPYTWYLFSAHGGGRLVVSKTTARGENLSATEQDAHWWLGGDIDTGR